MVGLDGGTYFLHIYIFPQKNLSWLWKPIMVSAYFILYTAPLFTENSMAKGQPLAVFFHYFILFDVGTGL